ncbi:helix-turn-helix domain-containing protein [Microbulbifer guangxiensis]|uniref:helix-turn-helix domain-containing protein n=1 Tax=Microbulbifer guangxiensis TaxID=2904249 RepID=UPI001F298FBD|nr:helix-turn-helix transcriptional regulator [Microbulbifer guangxiensis]
MKGSGESGDASRKAARLLRVMGEQCRHLRLAHNRSQEELAAASGIGMSTLKRLEKGQGCHLSALAEVLVQLGVSERCETLFEDLAQDLQVADAARLRASNNRKR